MVIQQIVNRNRKLISKQIIKCINTIYIIRSENKYSIKSHILYRYWVSGTRANWYLTKSDTFSVFAFHIGFVLGILLKHSIITILISYKIFVTQNNRYQKCVRVFFCFVLFFCWFFFNIPYIFLSFGNISKTDKIVHLTGILIEIE